MGLITTIGDEDTCCWHVGSVITLKSIDGDSVIRIFRYVWKSNNVSEIVELRPNFFLINPTFAGVKAMILKRRPWVVHDDLFSIEAYNQEWCADEYDFTHMVNWTRSSSYL
ncbi:hypothetical protein V6N13_019802 [Hibiscus sabdariffa]|uniref:DUF223 domain-containing protein n=1 Tax=Hibiscus sabdariffa TaxID=183260 RepID=A0ABR2EU30_9ROSI